MIKSLEISNYALIDQLRIEFGQGLNIITGETGAGKSILLGALSLLMGERAELKSVRDQSRKTIVEAEFEFNTFPSLDKVLRDADIDIVTGSCILRREITAKGGSRAFINDTPVNLALMKTVGEMLLDIHSQHQNLLLVDSTYQLEILDALADNQELLAKYTSAFMSYRRAIKDYKTTADTIKKSKSEADYITYQLEQLNELNLKKGELEQLEHDRELLANSTAIKSHLSGALNDLTLNDSNVLTLLSRVSNELRRVSEMVEDATSLAERLETVQIEVNDIVETLNEYDKSLTATPDDLDSIERRLSDIYSLQTKHHVSTGEELIELRNEFATKLETIENSEDVLAELEEKARLAKKEAVAIARQISERRVAASLEFAEKLKDRAIPMGMKNIRFEVRLIQNKLSARGIDEVEFLFAFNKNQPLMPVGKTASGGEISRVILALKSIMVDKMQLQTIIFDEVDTGVSGDVANRMADLMIDISHSTQVITITHLATVAARGLRHFKVFKEDEEETTKTHIRVLSDEERVAELALMISGKPQDPAAQANARALLSNN